MVEQKTVILAVVVVAIIASIAYIEAQKPQVPGAGAQKEGNPIPVTQPPVSSGREMQVKAKELLYARAVELVSPQGYINTGGRNTTISEIIGKKVIIVDFWTYSCINCQRTTPYLNAWYDKYADDGLEIIGVHTPEFEFEKDYANVEKAVRQFGIRYPVVQDNDFGTWTAYANRYWPRKYIIDIDGFVVYDHIGEGGYEETEGKIQELLRERKEVLATNDIIDTGMAAPSTEPVDYSAIGSPEIYFGAGRNERLANGESGKVGVQELGQLPASPELNSLYLSGKWDLTPEYAENTGAGKIVFRYQAGNVYFVASSDAGVKVTLLRDGLPLAAEAGADVKIENGESVVAIKESQLYKLVSGQQASEHTLEIIADQPGLKAFTFTFG